MAAISLQEGKMISEAPFILYIQIVPASDLNPLIGKGSLKPLISIEPFPHYCDLFCFDLLTFHHILRHNGQRS